MSHPFHDAIRQASFEPLGWFAPGVEDKVPMLSSGSAPACLVVIGNAGPAMFARFQRERDPNHDLLDDWCRDALRPLALALGAEIVFDTDRPALPFLTWARRAGAGFTSPIGLNIHPEFGLWHSLRAALLLAEDPGLPSQPQASHPCESCREKPCLSTCPVGAFSQSGYNTKACVDHIDTPAGRNCLEGGCAARHSCPVGQSNSYPQVQNSFHMAAFLRSQKNLGVRSFSNTR